MFIPLKYFYQIIRNGKYVCVYLLNYLELVIFNMLDAQKNCPIFYPTMTCLLRSLSNEEDLSDICSRHTQEIFAFSNYHMPGAFLV